MGELTVGKTAAWKGKDGQKPTLANAVKVGVCSKKHVATRDEGSYRAFILH